MWHWSADALFWQLPIDHNIKFNTNCIGLRLQAGKCDISHPLTWRGGRTYGRIYQNKNFLGAQITTFYYPCCSACHARDLRYNTSCSIGSPANAALQPWQMFVLKKDRWKPSRAITTFRSHYQKNASLSLQNRRYFFRFQPSKALWRAWATRVSRPFLACLRSPVKREKMMPAG